MSDRRGQYSGNHYEDAPHSRLFVIGSKSLNEDDYQKAFESYGHIEELWTVRDKNTGENKGIAYIKYRKTSEAARALEAMNGSVLSGSNRPLRVMIAASRDQGSKRDANEEEKALRLFIVIPRSMSEGGLYDAFKEFGHIHYVTIIRDRDSNESKGFGYVKYFKFSDAANAYEHCDRKYKAVFAEPRKPSLSTDERGSDHVARTNRNRQPALLALPGPNDDSFGGGGGNFSDDHCTELIAIVNPSLNQDQVWKLFDIVPGLDYCQLHVEDNPRPTKAIATVVYTSAKMAAYARQKLHGFEYPIGSRVIVKLGSDSILGGASSSVDILNVIDPIAQATSFIRSKGLRPDISQQKPIHQHGFDDDELCNVPLPDIQPLASIDDEVVARCFIVFSTTPPSNAILKNIFCRFGNLVGVRMLVNKTCGYVSYSSKESAQKAIEILHGNEIVGKRLKVMVAEERNFSNGNMNSKKRQRLDEDN